MAVCEILEFPGAIDEVVHIFEYSMCVDVPVGDDFIDGSFDLIE